MALVNLKCESREIAYTIRNKIVKGSGFFPNANVIELIEMPFLLWYGIWWSQYEDTGYALGSFIKNIFGVTFD